MLRITETLRASPTEHCESLEEALSIDSNAPPTTTEQLTLFTAGFPAKTSRLQASKGGCQESAPASGSRCLELFPNSDPLTSLLRTCVERAISPCQPSSPVWKEKATKCGQASFQLLHLERLTEEKDSSSSESGAMWPTPSQRDYKGANGDAHFLSKERPHLSQLPNAVKVACGLHQASTETTTDAD